MGSDSDLETMSHAADMLENLGGNGVPYEIRIASAHRSPRKAVEYARSAAERGLEVIICGAGGAAHLGGVLASETILPVISVPMQTSFLSGTDSLYSIVQMPRGIPVATMGVGKAGAVNAAVLAVEILALKYPHLRRRLRDHKRKMAEGVEQKDQLLQDIGHHEYPARKQVDKKGSK